MEPDGEFGVGYIVEMKVPRDGVAPYRPAISFEWEIPVAA